MFSNIPNKTLRYKFQNRVDNLHTISELEYLIDMVSFSKIMFFTVFLIKVSISRSSISLSPVQSTNHSPDSLFNQLITSPLQTWLKLHPMHLNRPQIDQTTPDFEKNSNPNYFKSIRGLNRIKKDEKPTKIRISSSQFTRWLKSGFSTRTTTVENNERSLPTWLGKTTDPSDFPNRIVIDVRQVLDLKSKVLEKDLDLAMDERRTHLLKYFREEVDRFSRFG